MKKPTQKNLMIKLAKQKRKTGFTYYDCHKFCNWPHKRLAELEDLGYKFKEKIEFDGRTKRFFLVGEPRIKSC